MGSAVNYILGILLVTLFFPSSFAPAQFFLIIYLTVNVRADCCASHPSVVQRKYNLTCAKKQRVYSCQAQTCLLIVDFG